MPSLLHRLRQRLGRLRRERRERAFEREPKLALSELRTFLVGEMGLRRGDSLFVHSGQKALKADVEPEELVGLLMDIVGPRGNLLLPFYPIKTSYQWLQEGRTFDLRRHRTNMGAIPIALAKQPDARKSIHPIKSVVVWGQDRDALIADHHRGLLPYAETSPYYRLQDTASGKIVGLGVSSDYLSCMHVGVDITPDYPVQPYHPDPMTGDVITHDGERVSVRTYTHDLAINAHENVPRFLRKTRCPTYREYRYRRRVFFSVEARPLVEHTVRQGREGRTFFYPSSLNGRQPPRNPPRD